jgi:hypothetical protein
VTKKQAEKLLKYKLPYKRNAVQVECKNKSGNNNSGGNLKQFKFIQKIPEQHTWTPRHQGTTENSNIGHNTYTLENATVKVQKI